MSSYPPLGPIDPPGPMPPYDGAVPWPQPGPQWPQPYWPQQQWPAPQQPSRKPLFIFVGVSTALIAALACALVYVFAIKGGDTQASAPDQIRQVVKELDDAYNRADATAVTGTMCNERKKTGRENRMSDASLRELLNITGPVSTSVTDIVVKGEHATAKVTQSYPKVTSGFTPPTRTAEFVHEDGKWRICGHK